MHLDPKSLLALPFLACAILAPPGVGQSDAEVQNALDELASHRRGESRAPASRLEALVERASATAEARARMAALMARRLADESATTDALLVLCRQLGRIGSPAEVPALAALLPRPELQDEARRSLERIPGDESLAALRAALSRTDGDALVGLIDSLGARRDTVSTVALGKLLRHDDPGVVEASCGALGAIGTDEAAELLSAAESHLSPQLRSASAHALLSCAQARLERGQAMPAAALFRDLLASSRPPAVRKAAYLGVAGTKTTGDVELVTRGLADTDPAVREAGFDLLRGLAGGFDAWDSLLAELSSFAPDVQLRLLGHLGSRGSVRTDALRSFVASGAEDAPRELALALLCEAVGRDSDNLALGTTADSPDGLDADGDSHGDAAAIDGDPSTYWDEADDQELYRFRVSLPAPRTISLVAITGFRQHDYAPRDFDVLADGRTVAVVRDAHYRHNRLWLPLAPVTARTVELRIYGCYGRSPAIRELEIYDTGDALPPEALPRFPQEPGRARLRVPAEEERKILAAAPARPRVPPRRPRRLLVFSRAWGFRHSAIPYGEAAIDAMAEKTGAFDVVFSDAAVAFEPASLQRFDAVVFNNTNNEIFLPEDFDELEEEERTRAIETDARLKRSLVDYLRRGGGLAVTHAGVASFRKWPEFGEIMGARFDNHPWNAGSTVALKIDDPDHPVAAAFAETSELTIQDEIYQLKAPYSRDRVRVLLSLDMEKTAVTADQERAIHRTDGDFAMTYVKSYGDGRVFYTAFGHQHELFWNPVVLQHYLDGIQFALGDLEGDTTPSAALGGGRIAGSDRDRTRLHVDHVGSSEGERR